jgi:DNA repair protein SbcD/Mre11
VLIISGNHDSPERIAFGGRILSQSNIYLSPVYDGNLEPVTLTDSYGDVDFFLLPFIKPAHVRRFFPEEMIETYTDAVRVALSQSKADPDKRTVLLTHQFVTGGTRSESEDISIGGSDNVDVEVFANFDYVALGHLHGPQQVTRPTIRYSGTPLKYSFSESNHNKSVTLVELLEKGNTQVRTVALTPRRDLRELRGSYMELTALENYKDTNTKDYVHITLTDEEDIPDVIGKLRAIYPHIMKVDYDNQRTRQSAQVTVSENVEQKTPLTLLDELFSLQNNKPMTDEQRGFATELIEKIWEGRL